MDFKTAIIILQILIIVALVFLHKDNADQDAWIAGIQEQQENLRTAVTAMAKVISQLDDDGR